MTLCLYHGKLYDERKIRLYKDADIFIFPTYYDNECFPLVLLEAMQQGLPIVTTNEGGISDIVDEGVNGYVCQKQNPTAIVEALEHLLNNPNLQEDMGKAGRNKVREEFTLNVFEERMCRILSNPSVIVK